MFSQGIRFCQFFLAVLSGMLFNLIKICVIQSQRFLIVFYVLPGSGSGSPGGTTPSNLVPSVIYMGVCFKERYFLKNLFIIIY